MSCLANKARNGTLGTPQRGTPLKVGELTAKSLTYNRSELVGLNKVALFSSVDSKSSCIHQLDMFSASVALEQRGNVIYNDTYIRQLHSKVISTRES